MNAKQLRTLQNFGRQIEKLNTQAGRIDELVGKWREDTAECHSALLNFQAEFITATNGAANGAEASAAASRAATRTRGAPNQRIPAGAT